MKEVYSCIDMADTEADDNTHVDIIVEAEITSNGGLPTCLTDHTSASPRLSLLDWAERLIQMTVQTEESSCDNSNPHSFPATYNNQERVQVKLDDDSSASTRILISSPPSDENHIRNNHNWQEMHLEDCLTLINADSNSDSRRNSPQSTSCNNLPSHDSSNAGSQDSDDSAGCDAISARTGKKSSHLEMSSAASSCVSPQSDLGNFPESDHQQSNPAPEMHFFSAQPSDTHVNPRRERQLTPDTLSVMSSNRLTSPIYDSFFNVNIDLDTTGNIIPLVLAKSSNTTPDYSLNTPVCETYPPLKSPSDSRVAPSYPTDECNQFLSLNDSQAVSPKTIGDDISNNSLNPTLNASLLATHPPLKTTSGFRRSPSCVTSDSIQSTRLDSSSNSRTISIESPENDLDLEGHVSDINTSPSLTRMLDDRTQQSLSPTYFSEADQLPQENDIPFAWAENNFEDVTVVTSSAHEQRPSHSSFQVQVQPCDDAFTFRVGESVPQFLNTDTTTYNYEIVELPSDLWTNSSEEHTSPDLSGQSWSLNFPPPCHSDSNQESKSSECALLNRQMSEDLIIGNVHNYCIDVNLENSYNPPHEVEEVTVSNIVNPLSQPSYIHVDSYSRFSHKQCFNEAPQRITNVKLNKITEDHTQRNLSKYIIHPKHKIKKLKAASVRVNRSLVTSNKTLVKSNTTSEQYIVPWPQDLELPDQVKENKTTERLLPFTDVDLPIMLNTPQRNSVTPGLRTSFWDVSSDAMLGPEDVVSPVLNLDNGMSSQENQVYTAQARTRPDINDIDLEGYDFSSSFLVASYIDGECSQERPTGENLKETLRSRLKAKRKIDVSSKNNHDLQNREKSSRFCLDAVCSTYPDSPSASCVVPHMSDGICSTGLVTISEQNSDSCSSSISQDGNSDDDSLFGKDKEDSASTTSSTQTSGQWKKSKNKHKGCELAQRERNRLAAQKCRKKKNDRVDTLTQQVQRLELKQGKMKSEVAKLEFEREELQEMLRLHSFFCAKDSMKKK